MQCRRLLAMIYFKIWAMLICLYSKSVSWLEPCVSLGITQAVPSTRAIYPCHLPVSSTRVNNQRKDASERGTEAWSDLRQGPRLLVGQQGKSQRQSFEDVGAATDATVYGNGNVALFDG